MMKNALRRVRLLILIVLLPSLARSQGLELSAKYCVRYVKDHLYYNKGDEMNVVDIEVEWPEVVDGQDVEPLQRFIAERLFKVQAPTFADAYSRFRERFGQPVTHLSQIPSDDKYCHVDCVLRLLDHRPGRYVSYVLMAKSNPGRASSQPSDDTRLLFTYDLQGRQVMTMPDILVMEHYLTEITEKQEVGPFMGAVIDNAIEAIPEWVDTLMIDNVCLVGGSLLLQGRYVIDQTPQTFNSLVTMTDASRLPFLPSYYVTTAGRRLLRKKAAKPKEQRQWQAQPYQSLPQANGQPVSASVDELPAFPGGRDGLVHFLTGAMTYPVRQGTTAGEGKCMVEFVVDSEGAVNDICVTDPVSQAVDREAARVMRLMPRWTPGKIAGRAVNTRMKLPLLFAAPGGPEEE